MGLVTLPAFGSDPATITAAALDGKVDPLATEFNGNIENVNIKSSAGIVYSKLSLTGSILNADISASAAIADTKLAQITTASKVHGTSITGLASVVSGAGIIPVANLGSGSPSSSNFLRGDGAWAAATPTAATSLSGSVIQVVNFSTASVGTGTTVMPFDDTIPQNSEGDQYMTLAITPNNASNLLIIRAQGLFAFSTGADGLSMALFQDSTANALSAMSVTYNSSADVGYMKNLTIEHYMTAGTTSSTTFKIRAGAGAAGTTTFNGISGGRKFGGVANSCITIMEIKA